MIRTLEDMSAAFGTGDVGQFSRYMGEDCKEHRCYREHSIEKKNGGTRVLHVPDRRLKALQRQLLLFFREAEISHCAWAYEKGKNLCDHGRLHVGQPMLVKLDLEDFFGSVSFPQVFYAIDCALRRSPLIGREEGTQETEVLYNRSLSWNFAKICTLFGMLPQGAPTSPKLSNMVFLPLDKKIASYCGKRGILYTRYSDDLIFSGDFAPTGLIHFVRRLLTEHDFVLNEEKTLVAGAGMRKLVTGVVVNQRPQVSRAYRRAIRQEIHYIGKFGLEEHLRRKGVMAEENVPMPALLMGQMSRLLGKVQYVLQIDPENTEFQQYRVECLTLFHALPSLCRPDVI